MTTRETKYVRTVYMFSAHAPSITIEEKADHQLYLLCYHGHQTAFLWEPQ